MQTENQTLLKRAKEAIEYYKESENALIKKLADTRDNLKKAREKYETLFLAEEKQELTRRLNSIK